MTLVCLSIDRVDSIIKSNNEYGGKIMWIIYKYTIKSILEKKLRTLLIILAISLSGALFIVSNELSAQIARIYEVQSKQQIGEVELQIKPNKHSPSNVINDKLAKNVSKVQALIPVFYGKGEYKSNYKTYDIWNLVGYHLEDYKQINTLTLKTQKNVETFKGAKLIISDKTAERYGITLGQTIELKINGIKKRLKVVGIAKAEGIFANESNGAYGLLPLEEISEYYGGNGKPNTLYVNGEADITESEMIARLKKIYPRYDVEETFNAEQLKAQMSWITQPFMLMTIIVIFISAFIIYSTFKVIMLEKMPIVGTFRSVGASQRVMTGVLLLEALGYGILGGGFGVPAGSILTQVIVSGILGDTSIKVESVKIGTMLGGFCLSVLVALVSTLIPIIQVSKISLKDIVLGHEKKSKKSEVKSAMVGIIIILIALGLSKIEDARYNMLTSISGLLLIIYGIIAILPLGVNYASRIIDKGFRYIFGNIGRLAAKNIRGNKSVLNTITLITLAISVVMIINTVSQNLSEQVIQAYDNIYQCDMEVEMEHMDINKIKSIQSVSGVQGVSKCIYQSGIECDETAMDLSLMGVEDLDFYKYVDLKLQQEGNSLLAKLQKGRYIIISEILARKYQLTIGDTLTFHFDNQVRKYTIIGTMDNIWNNGFMCLVPIKYLKQDIDQDYYTTAYVKIQETADINEVLRLIKERYRASSVQANTVVQMCKDNAESNANLMKMISVFGVLTLVIAIIGVVNNLLISFIERRKGLAVLRSVGMSKKQLKKMIFVEALGSGLISGLAGIVGSVLLLFVLGEVLFALNLPIKVEMIPELFVIYFFGASVITVIGTALPARSVPKLNIIECIKFE